MHNPVYPHNRAEAAARARQPGSVILQAYSAGLQAQRAGGAVPAVKAETAFAAGGYKWGGLDWSDYIRGGLNGVAVNEQSARGVAAVVACSNLISGSIASVPLHFYRESPEKGKERFRPDVWWLFNERPHPMWSASAFWGYLSDSRTFHGDGFARIHRTSRLSNNIASFEPHHPLLTDVERVDGRLRYTFWPAADQAQGRPAIVDQDDVLHIPGPGFNGVRSLSQLQYGLRYAAGIAQAANQQAAQFMSDGARPDFAIEVPGDMDDPEKDHLRETWLKRHSGQGAKKAPVVLTGGMKLHQLTMSMEDAQLQAVRNAQIVEICMAMGVPPHMIGYTEKTTSWGSGVEQMSIGFVKYTLQRHLIAFEQEINHKLYSRAGTYCQFLTAGLERGDIKTRYEAYRIAMGRAGEQPWLRASEVRNLEDLPPDDELDDAINPGAGVTGPARADPAEPKDPQDPTNPADPAAD